LRISIHDKALRRLCEESSLQNRQLRDVGARRLRTRLAELQAAATVAHLVSGRPHPLRGERAGQFALDLDNGRRLVFRPSEVPPPQRADGGIAWERVSAIDIVYIGDYHD
jgi:proteic killer suppression protein